MLIVSRVEPVGVLPHLFGRGKRSDPDDRLRGGAVQAMQLIARNIELDNRRPIENPLRVRKVDLGECLV